MKNVTKKKVIVCLSVLLAIGAVYLAYVLYQDASVAGPAADSTRLMPVSAEKGSGEKMISFAGKQKIAFKKYGFRSKLVIEEPTVVYQYVAEELGMEHVRFGIYRDAALKSPVSEADVGYNLKAWWDLEEGGDLKDYPDYKPDLRTFLEPGTYYVGLYTTETADEFTAAYSSVFSAVKKELQLEEGKSAAFFGDGNEETFFRIDVPDAGTITVDTHGFAGKLCLCDAEKKEISDAAEAKWEKGDPREISFNVKTKGIYYLKLADYPKEFTEKNAIKGSLFMNHIKYSYQK